MVGVAATAALAVIAGHRTVDKLSFYSDVIGTITAEIFPFVRRQVKSNNRVDVSEGYDLENELSELLNSIVEHCVESWYDHISDCRVPVNDARLLISNVTKCLVGRFSCVNRSRVLCKILSVYRQHLHCCGSSDAERHSHRSCIHCRDISSSENVACVDNKQLADSGCPDTVRYLNTIVFKITSKLIDKHYGSCLLGKEILAQIIVKEVLLRAADIASQPEWLYNIMADILEDSNDGHFVTDDFCTVVSSGSSADLHENKSSCYLNDVIDYCAPCEPQAADIAAEDLAGSGSVISVGEADSDAVLDDEQYVDVADTVSGSCADEYVFINGWFNDSPVYYSQRAAGLTSVEAESATTSVVLDCRSGPSERNLSQEPNHKDRKRPSSDSDFMVTVRQNGLKRSANRDGYMEQLDCDGCTSASTVLEALPGNTGNHVAGTLSQHPVSAMKKKRFSLGDLLPSFKTQNEKQKELDLQSASDVVHEMPRDDHRQRNHHSVAETSFTTAASQHALLKTKSLCSSLRNDDDDDNDDDYDDDYDYGDLDVEPSICHSASMNVLLPESRSDESANFLSRHFLHFVRRASSQSVRVPHCRSGLQSTEADVASDPEHESVSDAEAGAAEANEDFILRHRPQFLFDSVSISETERDVPGSKPYTVYVISVRIIQSYCRSYLACLGLFIFILIFLRLCLFVRGITQNVTDEFRETL